MTVVQHGSRYAVIDDFLSPDALSNLRDFAASKTYLPIDSVIDAETDGTAMRSRGGLVGVHEALGSTSVDVALECVRQSALRHPEIYGHAPGDWAVMSFAFWQYAAGIRLGWHNDAGNARTGEYILYLHDEWRPSWGGELVILDEPQQLDLSHTSIKERSRAIESAVAASSHMLTAIFPRPNRLVLVRAGTCHYINRVDKAAGSAKRISMTGFVSRPEANVVDSEKLSRLDAVLGFRDPRTSSAMDVNGG